MEMINLRTIITDIKDSLERLKRRMNMTEESISDSEDKTIEIAQSKKKKIRKEKLTGKKNYQILREPAGQLHKI